MSRKDSHDSQNLLLERRFPARAKEMVELRAVIRKVLGERHYEPTTVEDIVLAINEAVQNIIRHAYRGETDEPVVLTIGREGDSLVIVLRDYADHGGPDCMKPRDLDDVRPGGLGCHFMTQVMDEVSIGQPADGKGNVLRMVKRPT